jgi:cbb3-type cytochrome oxidase maturation protein
MMVVRVKDDVHLLPIKITSTSDLDHLSAKQPLSILQPISATHWSRIFKMQIMLFLILVSLLLAVGFLFAYLRASRAGQFDDEFTPAIRILFDDSTIPGSSREESTTVSGSLEDDQATAKR